MQQIYMWIKPTHLHRYGHVHIFSQIAQWFLCLFLRTVTHTQTYHKPQFVYNSIKIRPKKISMMLVYFWINSEWFFFSHPHTHTYTQEGNVYKCHHSTQFFILFEWFIGYILMCLLDMCVSVCEKERERETCKCLGICTFFFLIYIYVVCWSPRTTPPPPLRYRHHHLSSNLSRTIRNTVPLYSATPAAPPRRHRHEELLCVCVVYGRNV